MYACTIFIKVNNNCATGSTALVMAKQFIEGGLAECSMALGFEKMKPGSLTGQVQKLLVRYCRVVSFKNMLSFSGMIVLVQWTATQLLWKAYGQELRDLTIHKCLEMLV